MCVQVISNLMYLIVVSIFADDMDPGFGPHQHPREPVEWVLWDEMSRFGEMLGVYIGHHCLSLIYLLQRPHHIYVYQAKCIWSNGPSLLCGLHEGQVRPGGS